LFDITGKDLEGSGLSLIKVMDASGDSEEDHTYLSKDTRYLSETQTGHQPDPGVDGYHDNIRQRGRVASHEFCYARLLKQHTTFDHPEIVQSIKIKFGVVSDIQTCFSGTFWSIRA
jgi:hypothetical protein